MSRLWRNKYVWAVAALALTGFLVASRGGGKSQSSNIGTVTRGDLVQRVTIAGTANPNRKTIISAPYNGYVRKIYVQIGQKVREGDPVISLAQSLRGSAEDVYPLRAPFNGTVVQVLRTEGEYVEQVSSQGNGNAMVRIDDLTRTFVEANSPEIEVGKLKLGQEAVIKASAVLSRSYKGKIEHISLAAKEQKDWDKSRVEFPVLIEVTDNDGQLKPGMSVIVDIITNKLTKVLTLRHEFIQKDGEKYFVVTESGEKKNIEVGLQNEEAFEIKSGLNEGEKVRQTDFLSIVKGQ
jgi:multidrug efflux pump subunit AcrA (membrane-fusion protein)